MPPEQGQGLPRPDPAGRGSDQAVAPAPETNGSGPARPAVGGALPIETKAYRLPGAIVAWWAWLIVAVACLIDIAVSGVNHTGGEVAATVLLVTGVVYTCALRPRVIAGPAGITVRNPLRDHLIPWGSVTGVDLAESVRVHCAREPGTGRTKVIHSWALYSQRRQRLRAELARQGDRRRLPRSVVPAYGSSAADEIAKQPAAQIMAAQLDRLARDARDQGAQPGPRIVTWAWLPMGAILAPALLLVLVVTVVR